MSRDNSEQSVVSLVIIVFLFHFRSALIPILTVPIAVLASFIPMYYLQVSSNIMSLGLTMGDGNVRLQSQTPPTLRKNLALAHSCPLGLIRQNAKKARRRGVRADTILHNSSVPIESISRCGGGRRNGGQVA